MIENILLNRRKFAVGAVSLLLATALLAGMLPQVALAQTCARYHTVTSGDTLSSISVTYDISIAELATANSLTQPYTLTVGQSLCIPGTATTTTGTTTSTTPTSGFTVERQGNNLVITAAYPNKSNFYVKIKKGRLNSNEPWTKLGILRLKKNTEVARSYKLPKSYFNTPQFQVCLKNARTDGITCQSFTQ